MSCYFQPQMDALPAAQQRLWPHLAPTQKLGLVLYGGTAIALRLGHRVSVDFDFFTDKPLDKKALSAAFPFLSNATVLQEQPHTLTVLTASDATDQQVHVSFFGLIGFGRVGKPETTRDGVLQVASLEDLMATKLKSFCRYRGQGLPGYRRPVAGRGESGYRAGVGPRAVLCGFSA